MKLTGPSAVVAEFESSSKLLVGIVSTPPASVGASAPSVGVPPLRVWRMPLRAERGAVELVRAGLRAARAREDAEADALGLGGVVDLVGRAVVDVVDAGRVERDRGRVRRVGAAVDAVLDLLDAGARVVVGGGQRQRARADEVAALVDVAARRGVGRRSGLVLDLEDRERGRLDRGDVVLAVGRAVLDVVGLALLEGDRGRVRQPVGRALLAVLERLHARAPDVIAGEPELRRVDVGVGLARVGLARDLMRGVRRRLVGQALVLDVEGDLDDLRLVGLARVRAAAADRRSGPGRARRRRRTASRSRGRWRCAEPAPAALYGSQSCTRSISLLSVRIRTSFQKPLSAPRLLISQEPS